MNAFEKVIGYESIKNEMLQICDMIRNKDTYDKIGARLPHGLLLSGKPGLGKTLLCNSFIKESGLPSFTIRRNKNDDDFISSIEDTFEEAKKSAPAIIFLDDLDKFANEDEYHRDAEEYVAVQAGIDGVADFEVFVLATANDPSKLPTSLTRAGRFDRTIEIQVPSMDDCEKIIAYYLKDKRVDSSVNMEDLSKMIRYSSCAELETLLNEAAIYAAYKRKDSIEMSDLVNAVLRKQYHTSDSDYVIPQDEESWLTAVHEAGHLVCSEVLCPESVGFASIRPDDESARIGGIVRKCKDIKRRPHVILTSLASKAAVELYSSEHVANGCIMDLNNAATLIRQGMTDNATYGLGMLSVNRNHSLSASLDERSEAVTQALLENYLVKARDIIIKNKEFLELAAKELYEKGVLLYSDIQRIKSSVTIVNVAV